MGVGKNIKKIIDDKKMTVNELATSAGINPQTLYAIIKRDKPGQKVSPEILNKLSQVLGVSTTDLTGGIEILTQDQIRRTPEQIMTGVYENHVYQGFKDDLDLFSETHKLNTFGSWLESHEINFKVCKINGISGKVYSFGEKLGYKYFLTDEQTKQLPEMSIEQIKALIRSFDRLNKDNTDLDPE